jgi:hypothetical protein
MKILTIILAIVFFDPGCRSQTLLPTPSLMVLEKAEKSQSIILKWNAVPEKVIGYVIEKKEGDGPWLIVGQTEPHEMSYTDEDASAGTLSYRVRSYGNKMFSGYSNIKSAGTERRSSNKAY